MKYFLLFLISLISSKCTTGSEDATSPYRESLKIVLVDSLAIEYDDGIRKLPENIRDLSTVLVSEKNDCKRIYVLDPTLYRLDLNKELSIKTTIEKGGAKDVSNPKVIGRLIQKNLKDLVVPVEFTRPQEANKDKSQLIDEFLKLKSAKDSILVLDEGGLLDSYVLNKKSYKVYTTISDVRNRILSILCQNEKANFTLLINPPLASKIPQAQNPAPPISNTLVNKVRPEIDKYKEKKKSEISFAGSDTPLTIIKGSEGCEICTRYYSATDNLGRTHEVRENNSTNCCPCGKTIEMKGKTYRMDCEGNPHLELM